MDTRNKNQNYIKEKFSFPEDSYDEIYYSCVSFSNIVVQ